MFKIKRNLLTHIQVRDTGRMVDGVEEDVAMFDAKRAKVKKETVEWRAGSLSRKKNEGAHERGLRVLNRGSVPRSMVG